MEETVGVCTEPQISCSESSTGCTLIIYGEVNSHFIIFYKDISKSIIPTSLKSFSTLLLPHCYLFQYISIQPKLQWQLVFMENVPIYVFFKHNDHIFTIKWLIENMLIFNIWQPKLDGRDTPSLFGWFLLLSFLISLLFQSKKWTCCHNVCNYSGSSLVVGLYMLMCTHLLQSKNSAYSWNPAAVCVMGKK